jgi:pyridoxine/pyridoxamine 5'-phosphate oxidase
MENDLSNYRKNYQKSELSEEGISENPMELFPQLVQTDFQKPELFY